MIAKRRIRSVRGQLLHKAREAALTAVQAFNNPLMTFKSETLIVLTTIAWTYLLHAYYRKHGIEYRYYEQKEERRRFLKTKDGAIRYWELQRCLDCQQCPLDEPTKKNLQFLLGLRHEIEHHMPPQLDDYLSARYQACCVNFNDYIKQFFGDKYGIDSFLSYSIQFVRLSSEQVTLAPTEEIPANVRKYIARFDELLSEDELNSRRFALRFFFVRKIASRRGQADQVIEFVPADSPLAEDINRQYAALKEVEKTKYRPKQVVQMMRDQGFPRFSMHHHTQLWKTMDANNPGKGFGAAVAGRDWYWYQRWVDAVRAHCIEDGERYQ